MATIPKGRPSNTDSENQFATLYQFIRSRASTHGDWKIVGSLGVDLDHVNYYTYRERDQHVERLASYCGLRQIH
jgi:hypothetical protein